MKITKFLYKFVYVFLEDQPKRRVSSTETDSFNCSVCVFVFLCVCVCVASAYQLVCWTLEFVQKLYVCVTLKKEVFVCVYFLL